MSGSQASVPGSDVDASDSFVGVIHISSLLEVILWGSGCAPPLSPHTKEQILFVPFYSPVHLSLCNSWSPGYLLHALENQLVDTPDLLHASTVHPV